MSASRSHVTGGFQNHSCGLFLNLSWAEGESACRLLVIYLCQWSVMQFFLLLTVITCLAFEFWLVWEAKLFPPYFSKQLIILSLFQQEPVNAMKWILALWMTLYFGLSAITDIYDMQTLVLVFSLQRMNWGKLLLLWMSRILYLVPAEEGCLKLRRRLTLWYIALVFRKKGLKRLKRMGNCVIVNRELNSMLSMSRF